MAISRYENVTVNNVAIVVDAYGEQNTSITTWFQTRAVVEDVSNSLRISEKYRIYSDLVQLTFNYTPNQKQIVDNQEL